MNYFWTSPLEETVKSSERYVRIQRRRDHVSDWLSCYVEAAPTSSNQGTTEVPFQRWFKFKEAYSPKFVTDTLGSLSYAVDRCLDPFGGSGTTALTCRMLGIKSVTTEVNPFLADLIRVKLTPIDGDIFESKVNNLLSTYRVSKLDRKLPTGHPPTLTEPGVNGRYIFPLDVFGAIKAILRYTRDWPNEEARLVRVLLGSVLILNSNVSVNGKGRRYRKNWETKEKSRSDFIDSFRNTVSIAAKDLRDFSNVPVGDHRVIIGDTRQQLNRVRSADLAIFSPPYPNSFDYTDVYNVELWMLGYLNESEDNRNLRQSTLRSHVQTKWARNPNCLAVSSELKNVVRKLQNSRELLWDRNIPSMVQFYFDDLLSVFRHLQRILPIGHHAVVAIGDSQYANILIDISKILPEVATAAGFVIESQGEIRSMRSSSQHGGKFELSEHCMVFKRVK